MKNLKIKNNILFLLLILSNYILIPLSGLTLNSNIDPSFNEIYSNLVIAQTNSIITDDLPTEESDQFDICNWDEMVLNLDTNSNGIRDDLEFKLNSLGESSSLAESSDMTKLSLREGKIKDNIQEINQNIKINSYEQIKFIIQFPEGFDYSTAASILESYSGDLRFSYREAINGFAGTIDYNNFFSFCENLNNEKIPFFLEEDHIVKKNLYHTSLNMNLRPYVWKNLNSGYTGDNTSSIAILDTGIDEDHEFFDNFTNGDFRYKIVNWTDFTENGDNSTLTDYNGHGSHVAGIAAGMGTPILDGLGRSIATSTKPFNLTGFNVSDGGALGFYSGTFDVTSPGQIQIECNFTDNTTSPDRTQGWAWLYRGDTQVASIQPSGDSWEDDLNYTVTSGNIGIYTLIIIFYFDDGDMDGWVSDPIARFRAIIHWPFNPQLFGCGNPWKGVAPGTHLVGVRVLDENGVGLTSWVTAGVNYVIANRQKYNITVMSMSLGGPPVAALINAVDNAVENGIVTVVAAGNEGPGGNNVDSPGDADKVITVAAMNHKDQVASYSSQGGSSDSGNTIKPDIMAPGGSPYALNIFSADTNDNDTEAYPIDGYLDDLMPAQGTSMATPAVAGAANLLVQAMGGGNNWDWTSGSKSKLVKALLLMTATETYPLKRERYMTYSSSLNRGDKDVHEGYGRLNIGTAIQALTNNLTSLIEQNGNIDIVLFNSNSPNNNHSYAGFVNLVKDLNYTFNLTVPAGADYDLYLYNSTPDDYGQPQLITSGKSSSKGKNEVFNYTALTTDTYYLVVKAIGEAIPSDDDDDDDKKKTVTTIDLLPILIILGIIALLAIVFVIILYKKGRKDDTYDLKPEY